ncbi:MAG: asparagine synthase (glutamine-hydrolyzing) [Bacteroidales bacterium]|nr:asparagine synthase (glutamine-hydrolyzing) [Bacteroidales bacterium]
MCGIAGGTRLTSLNSLTDNQLINMLGRIKHRGPDESGIYSSNDVALGSVRLSIIDIESGQQPLSNSNQNIWITFNGEIFNYIELREELQQKGYRFKTQSDTEVIVVLYEEYGINFISKLNGQFAIAIWDKRTKELLLIRDRVGIRPLFYIQKNNELYFASEIKGLLEHPDIEANISPQSLSQIFTFWTCLRPNTIFKDIYELPPGHYMIFSKSQIKIKAYWELDFPKENNYANLSFEEAIGNFTEILADAVKIRLRADVPVAAYLSGGIDSTVTTSLIREVAPEMLQTFSVGFMDKEYDETEYQNLASDYYSTKHTGIKINSADIAEIFPEVVWHSETPILRTSPAPMYLLSKKVRDSNIKVVITGEGADEMLAGYNIFKESKIRRFWANQPGSKIRPLLLKKLYPYISQISEANSAFLKFFFGYKLTETDSPIYSHILRWNNGNQIKKYFSKDLINELNGYSPIEDVISQIGKKIDGYDHLAKAQWLETNIFMSGYLLSSQGDRMAMANSVEGRYPFLDYRLIEFCNSLEPDFKLKGLDEKYLLKKMAKGRIPDKILNRPKQAYRAPIQNSFAGTKAPPYINELFDIHNIKNSGLFDSKKSIDLFKKIQSDTISSETENMALTALLSTGLIVQQFQNKGRFENNNILKNCRIIKD